MNRRQFLAAFVMLLVAVCLLDLERLRQWWKSIGGKELSEFARAMRAEFDRAHEAFGKQLSRHMWAPSREPAVTYVHPDTYSAMQRLLNG
ncbi:MAG TPA: hypothetical protein VER96_33790 [Polyangiaceae bacterium]|nr:hypothetical protein [Polyangiaceae bacterium]